MKKMFTLAAMFAAVAMVACGGEQPKEKAEEVAPEAVVEAVEEVAPEAEAEAVEEVAPEAVVAPEVAPEAEAAK